MKTESRSHSLHNIEIGENEEGLIIKVKTDLRILPKVKKLFLAHLISTFLMLIACSFPLIVLILTFPETIYQLSQAFTTRTVVFTIIHSLGILTIGWLCLSVLVDDLQHSTLIIVTKDQIIKHKVKDIERVIKEVLCKAPYKAVYIRATSNHKKYLFSVIMTFKANERVHLFDHLTHEQAVYIARVINQYLKLDASQEDFFEPEDDSPHQHPDPDERDVDQHHRDSGEDETLRTRRVT